MFPLFPILISLPLVGYGLYKIYINKNSGRRVLSDEQLKRYERGIAFMALLSTVLTPVICMIVGGARNIEFIKFMMQVFPALPALICAMIGVSIGLSCLGNYIRARRIARRLLAFNFTEIELVAALQSALKEDTPGATIPNIRWFFKKYRVEGGNVTLMRRGPLTDLTFAIKPEERMLKIRNRVLDILRANGPFAETAPPFLRFSLRTLLLGTFLFGGLAGIYTGMLPLAKVAEWQTHAHYLRRAQ